jgi:energy-converting hydrogenase Eha subunit H
MSLADNTCEWAALVAAITSALGGAACVMTYTSQFEKALSIHLLYQDNIGSISFVKDMIQESTMN